MCELVVLVVCFLCDSGMTEVCLVIDVCEDVDSVKKGLSGLGFKVDSWRYVFSHLTLGKRGV